MKSEVGLPSGWNWVKLGTLVENPKQDLVDGPFGSNLKADEYVEDGVPVFKIQNIKANRFVEKNLNYVTEEKAASLARHSFKRGDLIITKLGDPLGLCCRVPDKFEYGIIVADLMRLRPSRKKVFDKYLINVINSEIVQSQFKKITKGTTRPRVNLTIVRDIEIPLPSIEEQQQIVSKIEEFFSELDKGIEELKTAQQQLKVYRQAVLKWAFEGKLTEEWRRKQTHLPTAEDLLKEIRDNKSNGKKVKELPQLSQEEADELFELPSGWQWEKNERYLYEVKDGTHDTPKYLSEGIPFITQKNIREDGLDFSNVQFISEVDHNKFYQRSNVAKGDILISMIGHNRGMTALVDTDVLLSIKNVGLFKFLPSLHHPKFSFYYYQSQVGLNLVLKKSKGGAQPFIGLTELRNWPVIVCSLEEQQQIVQEIESRLSVCDKIEETITDSLKQAEALRQSILKKAFEGKLA